MGDGKSLNLFTASLGHYCMHCWGFMTGLKWGEPFLLQKVRITCSTKYTMRIDGVHLALAMSLNLLPGYQLTYGTMYDLFPSHSNLHLFKNGSRLHAYYQSTAGTTTNHYHIALHYGNSYPASEKKS